MDVLIQLGARLKLPLSAWQRNRLVMWLDGHGLENVSETLEVELETLAELLPLELVGRKTLRLYASLHVMVEAAGQLLESVISHLDNQSKSYARDATYSRAGDILERVARETTMIMNRYGAINDAGYTMTPVINRIVTLTPPISLKTNLPQIGRVIAETTAKTTIEQDQLVEAKFTEIKTEYKPYYLYTTVAHLIIFTREQYQRLRQDLFLPYFDFRPITLDSLATIARKTLNFYFYSVLDILLTLPNTSNRDALLKSYWELVNYLNLTELKAELQNAKSLIDLPSREAILRFILTH